MAPSIHQNIYAGSEATYDGKRAKVICNDYRGTITLSCDGKIIKVNENDSLFNYTVSTTDPIQNMVEDMEEDIEKRNGEIKKANKLWSWCSAQFRKLTNLLYSLLRNNGVHSAKQLESDSAKEYYEALYERSSVRSSQLRASSDISWLSLRNLDDICSIAKFK